MHSRYREPSSHIQGETQVVGGEKTIRSNTGYPLGSAHVAKNLRQDICGRTLLTHNLKPKLIVGTSLSPVYQ